MKTTIYVEGGGNTKQLKSELRRGFQALFTSAGFGGKLPKVVAASSRNEAYDDFQIALQSKKPDEKVLLLVDSEEPVSNTIKWKHVFARDGWEKPTKATEEELHFMVVCMESWFLADTDGLARFFGPKFEIGKLPKNPNLEAIAKDDLYTALEKATKNTTKGTYGKGRHSFKVLLCLDGQKVRQHGKHTRELFSCLEEAPERVEPT
ncbi:DUF4276 family protein [Desulfurispira natronophila]|uniref:DUF4276 family protein n=1 Tax=Desulfurispira natronophila TaxID=682562 RepID=A0A7W7Y685_9BACT|nr:DUF4276 family protein [Desulfurispira natronophila]MBB5022858.1 hypothetical protein [Desulfurispira natronophila]